MHRCISIYSLIAIGATVLLLAGCSSERLPIAGFNERPTVELTAAPAPFDSVFYQVHLAWTASDPVGEVSYFVYAVDPPAAGDTTWVRTEAYQVTLFFKSSTPPDPLPGTGEVISQDFHVFVLKAVDNGGLPSAPVHRAFTSRTVAPQTRIISPLLTRFHEARVPQGFRIEWEGTDEDGVTRKTPVYYKYTLAAEAQIQGALGIGQAEPSPADLQEYFSSDAPVFAAWDSLSADSTFVDYLLDVSEHPYCFAVVAFDEAGAYEPRFVEGQNLLPIRVLATYLDAPRITVYNEFFHRSQYQGGIDLEPRRYWHLEIPEGQPVPFHWFAEPGRSGTVVTSYRWVLDPLDGNIFDETPRENEHQTYRWSPWSLYETSATVGPYDGQSSQEPSHLLYIQARDNVGKVSMVALSIRSVGAVLDKPLLIVDDIRGEVDEAPSCQPRGAFPSESILDSLLFAVGGMPWKYEPLGRTVSDPGVFAGFDYDTLDYRFYPTEGIPLSVLGRYRAVVWFIAPADAGRGGGKFTGNDPMAALRFINSVGQLNTLAVYLSMGGDAWLLGCGVAPAIANGYVSRFGQPFARYPMTGDGDAPSWTSILWPGNFLYDYLHARSRIDINTDNFFDVDNELADLVPYLPRHRTPGAPWPPVPGETPPRGADDDPRVGPSSERNLDPVASAGGWGIPAVPQDLPMLTITTEWPDYPRRLPSSIDDVSYVSLPNDILEDHDGDPGTPMVSRLDTLYVGRAIREIISSRPSEPDGKPMFFYYWGEDHQGDVCWTSVDLWYFERTQLQVLAGIILNKFGLYKNPNPKEWTGPGSAHATVPRLVSAQ